MLVSIFSKLFLHASICLLFKQVPVIAFSAVNYSSIIYDYNYEDI